MEHVDEGTIHAWLDGALAADEGARIAAHIAGCASCAAAVAEARGLIAASSRILSALDDVTGGVIPRRGVDAAAPAASVGPAHASPVAGAPVAGAPARGASPAGGARPPARRPWYRRPQYAAAAGIAFVALTTTVLLQRVGVPSAGSDAELMAEMRAAGTPSTDSLGAAMAAADVAAPEASPPAASQAAASQAAASPAAASPAAKSVAAAVSSSALERAAAAPRAAKLAATEVAPPASSASANDAARAAGAAAAAEPRVAAARREASNEAVQRVAADVAVPPPDRAREAVPRPAPVPSTATVVAGATRRADSAGIGKRTLAVPADSVTRAERLRLAGERDVQLQSVVVTGAGEARRVPTTALAPGARTPASLAGCYRLQPVAGAAASVESGPLAALERLELVFAAAGVEDARPAYVARDLAAPDAQPALRWTLTTGGQVLLVAGEGATRRRLLLAIGSPEDAPLAIGTRRALRVDCVER